MRIPSLSFAQAVFIHSFFEFAGLILAYAISRSARVVSRDAGNTRLFLQVFGLAGGLLGAHLLSRLANWDEGMSVHFLPGGKTIVGGLLGGWLSIEIGKVWLGVREKTGDSFVLPIILGLSVGRLGCFIAGEHDQTYGNATNLPWGVVFGSGAPRHPTQVYEILFLVWVYCLMELFRDRLRVAGAKFRVFMIFYLIFRLIVDFLKPIPALIAGVSAIQIACVFGLILALYQMRQLLGEGDSNGG